MSRRAAAAIVLGLVVAACSGCSGSGKTNDNAGFTAPSPPPGFKGKIALDIRQSTSDWSLLACW